eukprot:gnl/MRDRNA2_/MRDRNA2_354042_c0_seq1.p1 gnl/MRDRNA2_/MRDRNA2_354042_c0~~gnl/MRDRNA2_/MRDRNA2_354042_c0_seq1.p1  ORF type:complete len:215 (+),score=32.60 gnl/MRDRNA2_/MRDRNA2_354042_c0_seq1:89-646(+)
MQTTMQIHFNNIERRPYADTGSGLRMHYTTERPANLIATIMSGLHVHSRAMRIPPGVARHVVNTSCQPKLRHPIHVLGYFLHAHLLGRRVQADIQRPAANASTNPSIEPLGEEEPYLFHKQHFVLFRNRSVTLNPGDAIRVQCEYNSTRRKHMTYGGEGTDAEMCMVALMVYPKKQVARAWCFEG